MKKQFINFCKSIFVSLVIFSIFYHMNQYEAYQPAAPTFMGSMAEPFRDHGVHISAKAYDSKESKTYLNRDLIAKGYIPVQVTIQNNTAKKFLLSRKGVDLSHATVTNVTHSVNRNYIPRSIGFKVAAIFFWPFLIPSTIDTIITLKSHCHMKRDYFAKSIKDQEEAILPYSSVHRILFVRSERFSDSFTLHLRDYQTGLYNPYPINIEMS